MVTRTKMIPSFSLTQIPQQLDIVHSVSDRPLEHLSNETVGCLVENAGQLKEASGVVAFTLDNRLNPME